MRVELFLKTLLRKPPLFSLSLPSLLSDGYTTAAAAAVGGVDSEGFFLWPSLKPEEEEDDDDSEADGFFLCPGFVDVG